MFKRSVTYHKDDDSNLAERVVAFGKEHEFADIWWFPGHRVAVYKTDDRVPIDATGDAVNDFIGFRPVPISIIKSVRYSGMYFSRHQSQSMIASSRSNIQ